MFEAFAKKLHHMETIEISDATPASPLLECTLPGSGRVVRAVVELWQLQ